MSDTPSPLPPSPPKRELTDPQFLMGCGVLLFAFSILVLYAIGLAKDGDVKTAAVSFAMLIIGYYFGSSRGTKTETLTNLVKNEPAP